VAKAVAWFAHVVEKTVADNEEYEEWQEELEAQAEAEEADRQ
jgi:hypothetical protein